MATKRLLVIAPVAVHGNALREEIVRRAKGEEANVHLVAPAVTESKMKALMGDVDDAIVAADSRLDNTLEGLRSERVTVSGEVGDADPLVAVDDALGVFPADEVLVVTHSDQDAEWFEKELFDRAAERFEPPIIHVELHGDGDTGLAETEQSAPGISRDDPAEGELELTENLPPFSKRDLVSIVVAIVGTIVLALLATDSGDSSEGNISPARTLIAIAFALVNLAHVVGLVFFNSQQYRGFGRELFGRLSLFGTPIAIVVSLLI